MMKADLKEIKEFFGMSNKEMMAEWKELSPEEREYFKLAVGREIRK
jgi:hypothetical protein